MINYKLPASLDRDIDELEAKIDKYKKGEIPSADLKAHRVPFGVYEQRERDTYMVRIRCAAGCVTPSQLEEIGLLSAKYGAGQIHLTTRQELQIHYVKLEDIVAIIRRLRQIGLASRGGGGNTVRNITAQEDAGICPDEVFDVTGFAIALTSRLVAEEDSWTLPRKFKIVFSGSSEDKGYATVADIGFIAALKDGKKGFRVYVAGGMGAKSETGKLLFEYIVEDEVYNVARAVKTLFWKYGNRKNKHAARLRFLWQSLGESEFRKRFQEEYEALKREKVSPLEIEQISNAAVEPAVDLKEAADNSDFLLWKKRFVRPQKQENLYMISVPINLGFIDNGRLIKLGQFFKSFGDNVVRMTKDQNLLVRNIHAQYLPYVYEQFKNTLENFNRPFIFDKIISCAGASTCQLGICLSRSAARALMRQFSKIKPADLDRLADIKINISGCPNSCGQHFLADLGFFGKAARKGERLYPAYNVVAGALIRDKEAKLAQNLGEVSARDLPCFVRDFLSLYLSKADKYKNFSDYICSEGKEDLKQICKQYQKIPDFAEDENYYFDWDADKPFSLSGRGSGECSAGLFDLIELDLKNIQETEKSLLQLSSEKENAEKRQTFLSQLIFYAARMLLITRAVEPKTEKDVYDNFHKLFVDTALIDIRLSYVIKMVRDKDGEALLKKESDVYALVERVKFLYEHMDNSFNFQIPGEELAGKISSEQEALSGDLQDKPKILKDLRGIICPLNFVKTKIELSKMNSKEILEIWLDDGDPIDNVPGSVREEGHTILEQKKVDNYWSVVIQKK